MSEYKQGDTVAITFVLTLDDDGNFHSEDGIWICGTDDLPHAVDHYLVQRQELTVADVPKGKLFLDRVGWLYASLGGGEAVCVRPGRQGDSGSPYRLDRQDAPSVALPITVVTDENVRAIA